MSGINNRTPFGNQNWWQNPAPQAGNHTQASTVPAGSAPAQHNAVAGTVPPQQPPGQPSLQAQQNLAQQHQLQQYPSTQHYLAAVHGIQAGASQPLAAQPSRQEAINSRGAQLVRVAQSNMRHGQLSLTGSSYSDSGQLFFHGDYHPTSAMNVAGTNFSDFAPGQPHLINEHLDFYRDEFNEGENAQLEPVSLAPTEQGQLGVVDGHHRLAAGLSLGRPVPVTINLDTEPAEATNWAGVRLKDASDSDEE